MVKTLTLTHLFNMPPDAKARVAGKTFVGIDFGTSTTVVSIASLDENGEIRSECLHLAQRGADGAMIEAELLPTVIAINDRNKLIVGQGAYSLKGNPDYIFGENLWYQFKMELGKDLGPRWYNSRQAKIKCPQDATKLFFRYLKKCIEDTCKDNGFSTAIQYAVSIPASFESNQRKDLLDALEANDMCVNSSMFIDEPNAAFISYISHDYEAKQISLQEGKAPKVLVFDFGAGTCDISILEIAVSTSGITTRNISISQFQELGGGDIDRYIAWNILLPKLLKLNGKTEDDYTTRQLEVIVDQLLGIAEKLKIQACKAFHFLLSDKDTYHKLVEEGEQSVKINVDLCVNTDDGDLVQHTFNLGYKEFIRTMNAFLCNTKTVVEHQKPYNSINETLTSALNKAHTDASDIDNVIMVGGSSKNPFIQEYIRHYFTKEVLIGEDIQSLVSEGAAIHSLLLNGLDIAVVRPITSEAIVVITHGMHSFPVIPAGTEIPFSPVKFEGLTTGATPKTVVEIPICVSNEKKMLVNATIESKDELPFPTNTPIELIFEMTADKLLKVSAVCMDTVCEVNSENPFANSYLTDEERMILQTEREMYIEADRNKGVPSNEMYNKLRKMYQDADMDFKAAELQEEQHKYYPNKVSYNSIGVNYHNSGNYNKAIKSFQKALATGERNAYVYSNLGNDLAQTGQFDEALEYLQKAVELRGEYAIPMIVMGEIYQGKDEIDKAKEWNERAFNMMNSNFMNNNLDDVEKGWFISVARKLKKFDKVREIQESREKKKSLISFNEHNLASVSTKQFDKI